MIAERTACEFLAVHEANLSRFLPLYIDVFNGAPWNDGWSEQAAAERLQMFAQFPKFHGLGMLVDDRPVGLVLGWGERWVNGWAFHIKEMCISSELQRQGLGTSLMSEFESRLRATNFISVYLQTGKAAPAREFYEQTGYREFGVVSLIKRFEVASARA